MFRVRISASIVGSGTAWPGDDDIALVRGSQTQWLANPNDLLLTIRSVRSTMDTDRLRSGMSRDQPPVPGRLALSLANGFP